MQIQNIWTMLIEYLFHLRYQSDNCLNFVQSWIDFIQTRNVETGTDVLDKFPSLSKVKHIHLVHFHFEKLLVATNEVAGWGSSGCSRNVIEPVGPFGRDELKFQEFDFGLGLAISCLSGIQLSLKWLLIVISWSLKETTRKKGTHIYLLSKGSRQGSIHILLFAWFELLLETYGHRGRLFSRRRNRSAIVKKTI